MSKYLKLIAIGMVSFFLGLVVRGGLSGGKDETEAPLQNAALKTPEVRADTLSSVARSREATRRLDDLIEQISLADPEIAEEVRRFMESRRRISIFEKIAEYDPEEAARIFAELSDVSIDERTSYMQSLLSVWGGSDPEVALAWLRTNLEGLEPRSADRLLSMALASLGAVDPQAAIAQVDVLSDEDERVEAMFTISEQWMEIDAESALTWVNNMQPSQSGYEFQNEWRGQLLNHLVRSEPQAALDEILSLEPGRLRDALIPKAILSLSGSDLDAAIGRIESLTKPSEKEAALRALANSYQNVDSRKVIEFIKAGSLESGLKSELLAGAMRSLAVQDDQAAIELLSSQPPSAQRTMAEAVTEGLLAHGEESAMEWAKKQAPGPVLDGAASVIAFEVYRSDPKSSLSWLARITDPAKKTGLMRELILRTKTDSLEVFESELPAAGLTADQLAPLRQLVEDRLDEGYAELLIPGS